MQFYSDTTDISNTLNKTLSKAFDIVAWKVWFPFFDFDHNFIFLV